MKSSGSTIVSNALLFVFVLSSILCRGQAFVQKQDAFYSVRSELAGRSLTTVGSRSNCPAVSPGDLSTLARFGESVMISGKYERTDTDFEDGLALDLFSPRNRSVFVVKNGSPLPAAFVTGASGGPFVAISDYSYVIRMNETATDLIAKIELPYDLCILKTLGVVPANTYVGKLASDRKSWTVSESQRNVHISENKTRIIKMTSLDGEYLLLGRQTVDNAGVFIQYGQGATRTFNVTGGDGVQEAEFIDGLRLSVRAPHSFGINIDLTNGVERNLLPPGFTSLYSFSWAMNTSIGANTICDAKLRLPINQQMLDALGHQTQKGASYLNSHLSIGKRTFGETSRPYTSVSTHQSLTVADDETFIVASNLTALDGHYIIMVQT